MRSHRPLASRLAGRVLATLAAAHVAEALVLRRRARRLSALPPAPEAAPATPEPTVLAVAGATVDAATRRAVAQVLAAGDLDAVDLVPADLPAARALRLLRRLRPERLRDDPLHTPGGAHEVVAVRAEVAERAGLAGDAAAVLDRGDLVRRTVTAQRYAPRGAGVLVAPGLRASAESGRARWRELDELVAFARPHGALAPALMGLELAHLAVMTAGLALAPVPALAALATWAAQPLVVFGGRRRPALVPPALGPAAARRPVQGWWDALATAAAGGAASRAAARARPPAPTPPPEHTLFEARRTTCPWCGSPALIDRVEVTDLLQHKPGRFHLDECTACGHVFQNPALSLAGLDHYYDQFYEGEGEEPWEFAFAAMGGAYRKRTDALARHAEPRAWLDVGTGHGHFCLAARQRWPEAVFDGLDLSESVEEAARRGWIDAAYRGLFPDVADSLSRSYDVVSMHHYLEHTRDPRRELAAAAKALEPGGHLMIEGPDVDCPWSRRLGAYWRCWFQPQHQHFVTCDNLVAALEDSGFDVVAVERGPATEGMDITSAVTFWVNRTVPDPRSPWRPPPTVGDRVRRFAVLGGVIPVLVVTAAADAVKDAWLRRPGATAPGNAYRVVARRL
ncbi:MAG TPA: class I SAM-dependent methyltransferase [Acidimicrobiales bacterium]|nr:class I SAM-dependent methyltransferase [Acidimicrobiales bacterium]